MPKLRLPLAVLALLAAALGTATAIPATAAAQSGVTTPTEKALYRDGPSGRFLLDGPWLFRRDDARVGLAQRFMRQTTTAGWSATTVPNAFNATDESEASFHGTVGWYRKDFRLPDKAAGLSWIARFESVNYRARVWINGRPLGEHKGAYLPFEMTLPASALKRTGVNRLVIRVENVRTAFDFPPAGLSKTGTPTGGWWNYGGLLREVYLRKVDRIDFDAVQVQPTLPCPTCAATVLIRATLRNLGAGPTDARLTGTFGGRRISFGAPVTVTPGGVQVLEKTIQVDSPRLWAPGSPNLYDVRLQVDSGKETLGRYFTQTGIRSIKVVNGHLQLNGRDTNFRGVGLHEDSPDRGFAIDNTVRERELSEVRDLGATVIRSHYPLHPYTQERADQLGILLWSEIPVYAIKTPQLKSRELRDLAVQELETNILANGNHASVMLWSIGNELSSKPGIVQGAYIARAARAAKALDPTRPVALAVAGYPSAGCQTEYKNLDVIGINEYFGWYPGPNGELADRTALPEYLDMIRACYPDKALVISETGAEANRDGFVEERGTYQFQSDFVNYHFGTYATKPWLSGAIYWALEEFRVRPGWTGGNPRPHPPIHEKGLITFDGRKKPAYFDAQRIYKATVQFP